MPPLNALRAFEAAARHESFAKAADELGVTPAAVSQHVKALEATIGAALFLRRAQGLHLTEAGRAAIPTLSAAFNALGLAVHELRRSAPRADIHIAALPSIAQLWLGPRLPGLRAACPGARTSLHALEAPPDFRREPFDFAVFFVRDPPPGAAATYLGDDMIAPACTPATARDLETPADLARYPLLRDTSWASDWPTWLAAAGLAGIRWDEGPAFSLYGLAVQAAEDGAGILMAHDALVAAQLASGALVQPFGPSVPTGRRLAILAPERRPPAAEAMIGWLANATNG